MDGIADDVEPFGLISDHLRASAVANVRAVFDHVRQAALSVRDEAASSGAHAIRDTPLRMGTVERELNSMVSLAEATLDEVLEQDTLVGMASLKAHDNYTFEHSVEVAVYGVMLGKRLGMSRELLEDLALGCLVHDIGKQYIDERILNKPGKLDAAEFERMMEHPILGFQLVRQCRFRVRVQRTSSCSTMSGRTATAIPTSCSGPTASCAPIASGSTVEGLR